MKMIWHIMKKDFRAIWPLWLAWLALIAIRIPLLLFYVNTAGVQALSLMGLVGGCSLLADALLVVCLVRGLVHEDALAGDKSFWITRPITGSQLLVAKLSCAFIICLLSPLVLLVPTWLGFGFNQTEIARVLTYHGLLNSSLVALTFLFAVVTRRGSSFWLVLISTVVVVVILAIASSQWLSLKLSKGDMIVAGCVGSALVLFGIVQQFAKRRLWIAQGSLGATALIAAVIIFPHFPSYISDSEDGSRIDQPLAITWKSMVACFEKKEPKSSLPDYVRGELVISMPTEYSRIELQLLEGKWMSPTGRIDEVMQSNPRGHLIEEAFPIRQSRLQKEGQDSFTGRTSLFLSANCLWNLDQPWTYTGFSGRARIWFFHTATVADLKPISGAKARMGSFVTRLIGVRSYKDAVKIISVEVASSGSPDDKRSLFDPSGSKWMQTMSSSRNSPPILWVRFAMLEEIYCSRLEEESGREKARRLLDRDFLAGGETHENLAELGWRYTSRVDQVVGYNDYDLKADHIEIYKESRP